ncbi:MAG: septum formation initiator family protein [Clostridia bacterium]|nr:septum formation initiator family protein [Clostridia bacterium]
MKSKEKSIKKSKSVGKAKHSRKMNPVVRGLLIVALVYVAGNMTFTCIKLQSQIREKKAELGEVQQKVSSQTIQNEQLNDVLGGQVDLEYIEKVAREQNYVKPGEVVFDNVTDR